MKDRKTIRRLKTKCAAEGFDSLTQDELTILTSHQHKLMKAIKRLEKFIKREQ